MFNKIIRKFCVWLLSKTSDEKIVHQKIDISNKYNKVSIKRIAINNKPLISNDIYLCNVDDNKEIKPYMKCCERSYKQCNPNFNIHFINLTYREFYDHEITKKIIAEYNLDPDDINALNKRYTDIFNYFKYNWIYKYGGIWCNLTTFCCRNLNRLILNNNFMMTKYTLDNKIIQCDCCFGVQKNYPTEIKNNIYPPINMYYSTDYDSMKLAFYNNMLDNSMFTDIKNEKFQNYICNFE